MFPPIARTTDEAHVHMAISPCTCGEVEFDPASTVQQKDGAWVVQHEAGVSVGRGSPPAFQQPDEFVVPGEGEWATGAQPSELLDAGQWLRLADTYGAVAAEPEGLSDEDREAWRQDVLAAAASVDEVLKFLTPGADEVPESAFWSPIGRQVRLAEPGRFRRARLEATRSVYRASLETFGGGIRD